MKGSGQGLDLRFSAAEAFRKIGNHHSVDSAANKNMSHIVGVGEIVILSSSTLCDALSCRALCPSSLPSTGGMTNVFTSDRGYMLPPALLLGDLADDRVSALRVQTVSSCGYASV